MTLAPGPRYVTARFSPVTLKISKGDNEDTGEDAFGSVTVTPKPSRACGASSSRDSPCRHSS